MKKTELGWLKIGDEFYINNQKHKSLGLGNRDINNVLCINLETKKRIWLDTTSDVELKEE